MNEQAITIHVEKMKCVSKHTKIFLCLCLEMSLLQPRTTSKCSSIVSITDTYFESNSISQKTASKAHEAANRSANSLTEIFTKS